jgi:hypothetical protein
MNLENFYSAVLDFQKNENSILSKYESSTARIITIDNSYKRLSKLSLRQEELFQEAFKCIEQGLFRSAIVMAWASFVDFLGDKLGEDNFNKLNKKKNWSISNTEDLREKASDSLIIECTVEIKLINNKTAKSLRGLLAKRNECGHPSDYRPGLNDSLGYIDEILKRIELLQKTLLP